MPLPASSLRRGSCFQRAAAGAATVRFYASWWKASSPRQGDRCPTIEREQPNTIAPNRGNSSDIHHSAICLQHPGGTVGHRLTLLTGRVFRDSRGGLRTVPNVFGPIPPY